MERASDRVDYCPDESAGVRTGLRFGSRELALLAWPAYLVRLWGGGLWPRGVVTGSSVDMRCEEAHVTCRVMGDDGYNTGLFALSCLSGGGRYFPHIAIALGHGHTQDQVGGGKITRRLKCCRSPTNPLAFGIPVTPPQNLNIWQVLDWLSD